MKTIYTIIGISVAIFLLWIYTYPSATWRYKVTINIETPEGLKSGSAVRELNVKAQPRLGPLKLQGASNKVTGEAVVVDLGKRGLVIAPMDKNNNDESIFYYTIENPHGVHTKEGIRYYSSLESAKGTVKLREYPLLIFFPDVKDSTKAELVYTTERNPSHSAKITDFIVEMDNFQKFYGQGVTLRDITVEKTKEPVTQMLKQYLPWISLPFEQIPNDGRIEIKNARYEEERIIYSLYFSNIPKPDANHKIAY